MIKEYPSFRKPEQGGFKPKEIGQNCISTPVEMPELSHHINQYWHNHQTYSVAAIFKIWLFNLFVV